MGFDVNGGDKCFPAGWSVAARPCDSCKIAAALLFCRSDSAFMCVACDAKVHGANMLHERVWMCEVCEQAPASVTCNADAAALCVTCDRDIHSANPLARRHDRVPVVPFYDTVEPPVVKSIAASFLVPNNDDSDAVIIGEQNSKLRTCFTHDQSQSSLLVSNHTSKLLEETPDMKAIEFLLSDSDKFLDFDYAIPTEYRFQQYISNSGTDSIVPIQPMKPPPHAQVMMDHHHSADNHFEIDFTSSTLNSFNTQSFSKSTSFKVSSTSLDVGIVPDGSCMSDISYPSGLQMNRSSSSMDLSGSSTSQASQLSQMDRKARVLRYREKRENRKFEKTIRYASRKAYAERRPRIKGRFAKRADAVAEADVDRWFTSSDATDFIGDSKYGVVPSF